MARLTTKARKHLQKSAFALPSKKTKENPAGHGAYPIPDRSHAANALSRVSQFGTEEEKARVRAKVHARFPNLGKDKKK